MGCRSTIHCSQLAAFVWSISGPHPLSPPLSTTQPKPRQQQQQDKAEKAVAAVEDEKEREAQQFIQKHTAAASTVAAHTTGTKPSEEKREKYIASVRTVMDEVDDVG